MPDADQQTLPSPPVLYAGSIRQRDPIIFSGTDDDVEDWLASYELPVLVLATVLAFASGGSVSQQRVATRTGTSTHFKTQDSQGNYRFGYDVVHSSGSSFHKEEGSNGVKVGSYGLRDIDGRVRVVNYVADAQGFRADVRTNEPGVEPMKDPAGATISRPPPVAALPPVDFTAGEPSGAVAEEPSDEEEEAVATVTAEPTGPPAELPAEGTADVQAAPTSGRSTVVPPVSIEPDVIQNQPGAAKDTDTSVSVHAGGDVAPPEVLTDVGEVSAKPPARRRSKPRPPVFPPSPAPRPVPSESPPSVPLAAPAAKEIGGVSSGPSPKRPGAPPRRKVSMSRYPFYVDAADVHIVGPTFHPAPAVPFHRRPGGFQVAAFHGSFPFKVARHPPFSPAAFGYFPAGVPQLSFAPRHPAGAFHPAFYANPALASAFFHSAQLSHAGFPLGQLKWPYHAPFLPPVVAFPF
ncbi:uncharacterized protein LOC142585981 isoform X1 [Dermacentor variabilis]|uniref:uncharacterized protein LOC142585981 isoform X1 n=1 Tax=Dermacentor variabilis TaxID=34621 RepID=UPI003F5C8106